MKKRAMKSIRIWGIVVALGMCIPLGAQAIPIALGGLPTLREAILDSAIEGFAGTGNATAATLDAYLGALAPWTEEGSIDPSSGGPGSYIQGLLTVKLSSGSWGGKDAAGTWTINRATFWTLFEDAAISIHVGNGGDDEYDHFVWRLAQGTSSGSWAYDGGDLRGGGLSNIKLYSSGTGTSVPDGGMTLALLGMGILSIAFLKLRRE